MRSDLMQSIAIERDAGKTKKQVKKIINDSLLKNLPSNIDLYINAIYEDSRKIKPEDIGIIFLYSCYKEFGLIK